MEPQNEPSSKKIEFKQWVEKHHPTYREYEAFIELRRQFERYGKDKFDELEISILKECYKAENYNGYFERERKRDVDYFTDIDNQRNDLDSLISFLHEYPHFGGMAFHGRFSWIIEEAKIRRINSRSILSRLLDNLRIELFGQSYEESTKAVEESEDSKIPKVSISYEKRRKSSSPKISEWHDSHAGAMKYSEPYIQKRIPGDPAKSSFILLLCYRLHQWKTSGEIPVLNEWVDIPSDALKNFDLITYIVSILWDDSIDESYVRNIIRKAIRDNIKIGPWPKILSMKPLFPEDESDGEELIQKFVVFDD